MKTIIFYSMNLFVEKALKEAAIEYQKFLDENKNVNIVFCSHNVVQNDIKQYTATILVTYKEKTL